MMEHKLAYVGQIDVYEAFRSFDSTWDMQIPLPTLYTLENEIYKEGGATQISPDTAVFIFDWRLYKGSESQFADLVAYLAPYSVTCVLVPENLMANYRPVIEQKIKQAQLALAKEDPSYNTATPFYFIDYYKAHTDIYASVEEFCNSPIIDNDIKEAVRTMLPDIGVEEIEDFSDYEQSDTIVIPDSYEEANGQVITVTSSKGGSGKSTVALTLGAYIAKASIDGARKGLTPEPLKVCLVDLDIRDGQHQMLTMAKGPSTISDILGDGGPSVENIKKAVYHSDKMDCDFIFAPKRPRNAKEIPPQFFVQLISNLKSLYDVIILDTSVNYLDPLGEEVAYPMSDKIVFVSDMGRSSILGCRRWIREMMEDNGDKNIPRDKVCVVINKAMREVNMSRENIEKATTGLPVVSLIPSQPSIVTFASNVGELHRLLEKSIFNEAISNLAESVIDTPLGIVPCKK